jgi:hypothetical protein
VEAGVVNWSGKEVVACDAWVGGVALAWGTEAATACQETPLSGVGNPPPSQEAVEEAVDVMEVQHFLVLEVEEADIREENRHAAVVGPYQEGGQGMSGRAHPA